jgi:hypothetical protein
MLQYLQAQRIRLLIFTRAAAGGIGFETPVAEGIQQGLGKDATGGIVRAEEQDIQRDRCRHIWGLTTAVMPGLVSYFSDIPII